MMKTRAIHIGPLAGILLMLPLVSPDPLAAQQRPTFNLAVLEVSALRNPLHVKAERLYETPARWIEAADLHETAAERLPENDAAQYFGFRQAAILYFHADALTPSRRAMERAADVAEATGDVLVAAHAWVDAAFLAVAEGYPGKRREFVRNAVRLADSEVLTEEERARILDRIAGAASGEGAFDLAARLTAPAPATEG